MTNTPPQTKSTPIRSILILLFLAITLPSCLRLDLERLAVYDELEEFKQSKVLVRLVSTDNKIRHLEKINDTVGAEVEKKRIQELNNEIKFAFISEFNFCDFYFYYPKDAEALRAGKFSQITLFDRNEAKVDADQILKNGYHLIEMKNAYRFPAFILTTSAYNPLSERIPQYVAVSSQKGFIDKAIGILNDELNEYYNYSVGQRPELETTIKRRLENRRLRNETKLK